MIISTQEQARKILGERLKREAKKAKKKYDDLAHETGITRSYLSRVFNGHQTPSIETLYKLSKVLNFEVEDIVTDLEYWILPKGFKFNSKDISTKELEKYYGLLDKSISLLKFKDKNTNKYYVKGSGKKNVLTKKSKASLKVRDDSMNMLGIFKDDDIIIIDKELDLNDVQSGKIYLVKAKRENDIKLRKVFKAEEEFILVPYSNSPNYEITSIHFEDLDWIKRAIMIARML